MYSLQIKHTGVYDPDATDPDIVVTRDPDHPGTYIYSWTTYRTSMSSNEINGTLDEPWNGISTFTFNVYYGSPCWDVFFPARTAVRLWDEKDQKFIFTGRVADVTENMGADGLLYRTVQCESELAYFCDSICDTQDVLDRLQEYNRSMNARDVLVTMLELHHFNAGGIAATITKGFFPPNSTWNDNTNAFDYPSSCYPTTNISEAFNGDVDTTWALMQDILVENLGMDIWVTYNDDAVPVGGDPTWTFGYNVLNMRKATDTGIAGDPITISTNMKSLKIETSPTSNGRITRIVPLGGIGVNGRRLDVSSIPQYHEGWIDPSYEKQVANEILSITYGLVDKVSLHEDLVDNGNKSESEVNAMIQELYRRGKAEADALSGGITSISIEAVDLYEAGYTGAHKFEIGSFHRIVNEFFGLDETFKLVRKVTDLAQPWNPKLEFAKGQTSQTNLTKNRQVSTSGRIYNVENMISSRLDRSAVKRTTQSAYDAMTSRNPTTVHYADQGDGTWKAYMGDEPIKFGDGGWEVDTAIVLDSNSIHDWVATQELIEDISANTKLYYGGNQKTVVAQGYVCRFGSATLDDDDADNFGTKIELDSYYRESGGTYSLKHYIIELFVNQISTSTSGGVTSYNYTFGFTVSRYAQGSQVAEAVNTYTTVAVANPTDAFIVLRVTGISFAEEFSTTWGGVTDSVSSPYGYVVCNNLGIQVGALTASAPTAVTFPNIYSGSTVVNNVYLNGTSGTNESYRCVLVDSNAEKYFDMALSQRSEPTGGDD